MEVEIRHLRVIVAIAESGSLNRASKVLGLSQPGLTSQLQRIEHSLGGQLFFRAEGGSSPTPFGHNVLTEARAVLRGLQGIRSRAESQARHRTAPPTRVGGNAGFVHLALSRWLVGRAWVPGVRLTEETDPRASIEMVTNGALDLAVVYEWPGFSHRLDDSVRAQVVVRDEPVLVMLSPTHPLAAEHTLRLDTLAEYPWVDEPPQMSQWPVYLSQTSHRFGVSMDQQHEVLFAPTAHDLVATRAALAPALITGRDVAGSITLRPLTDNPLRQRLRVVYRPDTLVGAHIEEITAEVITLYHDHGARNAHFRAWWAAEGRHTTPTF
ncbi:LysR family transcriptional regulator [Actinokineospora cianjurensis]|uniref:DNA-binding transcriptional LysR family regulator n=1 Tax=Actinokineospora cianjurensis TaxID=585224 RepID=A0A421B316_9PSEU|nr:LysR family transcriptional regulator [Actinokineospora cianjurensis]RLK58683.1 DNA-binding transcriptional LysR family regulator [Actinokineospora cianjurensis]